MKILLGKGNNPVLRLFGALALLISLQTLTGNVAFATCTGTCATDTDCAGKACVFCNQDFGVCSDCCEFVDSQSCPGACSWSGTDCRNNSNLSCLGLPETPKSFPRYLYLVILAGILGIAWFGRKRVGRKPKDSTGG